MINLNIADTLPLVARSQHLRSILIQAAQAVLDHQRLSDRVQLTILLSGDEQIQQLNRQFRGVDAPTDVLAFAADYTDPESGDTYLGDVIVSFERAQAQAEANRLLLEDELRLLVVHGVLHLLGYDHIDQQGKKIMWPIQEDILGRLGIYASWGSEEEG